MCSRRSVREVESWCFKSTYSSLQQVWFHTDSHNKVGGVGSPNTRELMMLDTALWISVLASKGSSTKEERKENQQMSSTGSLSCAVLVELYKVRAWKWFKLGEVNENEPVQTSGQGHQTKSPCACWQWDHKLPLDCTKVTGQSGLADFLWVWVWVLICTNTADFKRWMH